MLSTVPREFLMLNTSTSKHMDFFYDLRNMELTPYYISYLPSIKVFCCPLKWVARVGIML